MGFHRQPTSSRHDLAEDIRAYVHEHSDKDAKLESLERLTALDLTVLALALDAMARQLEKAAA